MKYDMEFYSQILKNINMGIMVLDVHGNYLYVNDIYCRMVHKPLDFFQNMSIPKLKEMGYLSISVWEQVLQNNAPVVALVSITDKQLNLRQQYFTSGTPTFNSDGGIKYIFYLIEPMESIHQRIQAGMLNRQTYTDASLVVKSPRINIIAESPKMKQLLSLLTNVSKTDASVLILGPTGSGKEVLAEYAHYVSWRSKGPFISVDCASIPENLLESELFGYEKGAFTGASTQGKKGQIELANGGTLFMDEVNSLPLGLQGKLLRFLETRKVKRIGSLEPKPIDFRLVCASNEDLETLVKNGGFRADLYYRISVVPVTIPPLREHREDIVPLSLYYLQYFCKKYSRMKLISENLINVMLSYDWPGNVRELRNFIERIVVTSPETDLLMNETLPNKLLLGTFAQTVTKVDTLQLERADLPLSPEYNFSYRSYMEQCEKKLIQDALARFKTPAKVAEVLNLDLSNIYRKIRKHGL